MSDSSAMVYTCHRHQMPDAFGGTEIPAPAEIFLQRQEEQPTGFSSALPEDPSVVAGYLPIGSEGQEGAA